MTVIVNNISINYQKIGKGPVLVLLHGWGDSISTFNQISNKLKDDYTLIALDLPGFGASETPQEAFDLDKYARFVSDFLEKIGENHIYGFIGHSNGGAIAIKGISEGFLSSDRLVLIASSGVRSVYNGRKKVLRLVAKTVKIPTKILPKSTQKTLKKKAYSAVGSDIFVAENLQETFKNIVSEDLVQQSALIQQPTLLIYGSDDKSTPVTYANKFNQEIENSELIIIQDADHFLHQTHSEQTIKAIKGFLEK